MQWKNASIVGTLVSIALLTTACGEPDDDGGCPSPDNFGCDTYDVDAKGIPELIDAHYIELDRIGRISRFRSGVGHAYEDRFEACRSMKHYFDHGGGVDVTSIRLFAPADAIVLELRDEPPWGTKVTLKSMENPAFFFEIFHINLTVPLAEGDTVASGEQLGTHADAGTFSDIAVAVLTPGDGPREDVDRPPGWKLLSYFDVMTEDVFADFSAMGLPSRETTIISGEERDASPLECDGETFLTDEVDDVNGGSTSAGVQNWALLN